MFNFIFELLKTESNRQLYFYDIIYRKFYFNIFNLNQQKAESNNMHLFCLFKVHENLIYILLRLYLNNSVNAEMDSGDVM